MENETRMRVAVRPKCHEIKLGKGKFEYRTPSNRHIYAKLSSKSFESMTITLSPYADVEVRKKVEKLFLKNGLLEKTKIVESVLTGEVKRVGK